MLRTLQEKVVLTSSEFNKYMKSYIYVKQEASIRMTRSLGLECFMMVYFCFSKSKGEMFLTKVKVVVESRYAVRHAGMLNKQKEKDIKQKGIYIYVYVLTSP
jgi:hypothetical protein